MVSFQRLRSHSFGAPEYPQVEPKLRSYNGLPVLRSVVN
jgi:hypothetical protein